MPRRRTDDRGNYLPAMTNAEKQAALRERRKQAEQNIKLLKDAYNRLPASMRPSSYPYLYDSASAEKVSAAVLALLQGLAECTGR